MIGSAVAEILDALDADQQVLLAGKLAGVSDADVSRQLGVSRPTAAKRKQEVLRVLEETGLEDLPPARAIDVLAELAWALVGRWPGADGGDLGD